MLLHSSVVLVILYGEMGFRVIRSEERSLWMNPVFWVSAFVTVVLPSMSCVTKL